MNKQITCPVLSTSENTVLCGKNCAWYVGIDGQEGCIIIFLPGKVQEIDKSISA